MKVATYEGVVENGQVRLPAGVTLPEKAKVYVVVPGVVKIETPRVAHVYSPRLAHPEQAKDFVKRVRVVDIEERPDAQL
jgi:hypothetical protein